MGLNVDVTLSRSLSLPLTLHRYIHLNNPCSYFNFILRILLLGFMLFISMLTLPTRSWFYVVSFLLSVSLALMVPPVCDIMMRLVVKEEGRDDD